ncbi:MAG: 50S ribosomal protein L22 [Kiritimatiellia bacterium]
METTSILKFQRISSRKAVDIARAIQGKPIADALNLTHFSDRKAATLFEKALKSAVANAEHNEGADVERLVVKRAVAEQGPTMRRGFYGARGMFKPIAKRTSHIRVVLSDGK